jgi:predicted RNase H-like nuclease
VLLDAGHVVRAEVLPTFADVVALGCDVVTVDIPFVLQADQWRAADYEAKRFLGARHSTLFMTPPAAVVECADYPSANARCRELTGGGLSKQMFNLFPRIREVLAAGVDVYECHPEMVFARLAGQPLPSKRTPEGMAQRRALLAPLELPPLATHDVLDAAACALAAADIAAGRGHSIAGTIWY